MSTNSVFSSNTNTSDNSPHLLLEDKETTAVMAFGRLNPPTIGHVKLVDAIHAAGDGHYKELVVSSTQDAKNNPLSPKQKLKHLKRYFPDITITVASADAPTLIHHAKRLNKAGHKHLIFVAGSDRTHDFKQLLNKYNGKEYKFKSIKIVSAGKRDPDAEGAEGVSASKMREYAQSGNFKEFRKGVPRHLSDAHTKELYHDVRQGMSLKESAELTEGVHDAAIFKAVFLVGGPGSGKDFVLKKTLDGHGLTEINSDKAFEFLMDKEHLNKKMPDAEREKHEGVRKRAKSITDVRQQLALDGRNGLIINGTADNPEKTLRIKKNLEDLGYSTLMIFVNTADNISKQRNVERGERGGRTVPEEIRKEKWATSQKFKSEFEKEFGDNFINFDNSDDLRANSNLDSTIRKQKTKELENIWKTIKKFTEQGAEDPKAQAWIDASLEKKVQHAHTQHQFGMGVLTGGETVKHSEVGKAAHALGLQYYGFGRYGKMGKITHITKQGKLVPVTHDIKMPAAPGMPAPGMNSRNTKPLREFYITEETSESDVDRLAKAHGVSPSTIVAQLEMGIEMECEHAQNDTLAMQIALDHLKERPDYYTQLMETKSVKPKSLLEIKKSIRETSFGYDETTPSLLGPGKDEINFKSDGQAAAPVKQTIFLRRKKS